MKKANLIDSIFKAKGAYVSAIMCTYGLNLHFLEEYLMNLDALYTCEDICIFTDSATYGKFLNTEYHPRWLNKKYLVNRVETKGVFHSKLYMLASEKKAKIGIGSCNLTRDGMTTNLELLSSFEVSEKDQRYAPLLFEVIKYIQRVADITKSPTARRQVETFTQLCLQFINEKNNSSPAFINNFDKPIIDAVISNLSNVTIEKVQIVSPFFDQNLSPLYDLKNKLPDCVFEIYLQQGKTNFPVHHYNEISKFTKVFLYPEVTRFIHGKAIIFHSHDKILLLKGSPNFTRGGLMSTTHSGNFETALFGEISKEHASEIVKIDDVKIEIVSSELDIRVDHENLIEHVDQEEPELNYIVEAIKDNDTIIIKVDPDFPERDFKPENICLMGLKDNTYVLEIIDELEVSLTPQMKKVFPGIMAVQLTGSNNIGKNLKSNIAWVVELEEKNSNPDARRFRRVYNDPSELAQVLQEILESDGHEALKKFLYRFDISIDLILPPRKFGRKGMIISKGNIIGELPEHIKNSIFSDDMQKVFRDVMVRLFRKLEAHRDTPQVNKIDNFIMIYSALFSVISFVNNFAYSQLENEETITPKRWSEVRDYYDLIFQYLKYSWELLWGNRGYSTLIGAKIKEDDSYDYASFEKYLFDFDPDYLHNWYEVAKEAKKSFDALQAKLKVKTVSGEIVKPKVFAKNVSINKRKLIKAAFAKSTVKILREA